MQAQWQKFEVYVAEMFSLRRTITSGNKWYDPGDAVTRERDHPFPLFCECKFTEHFSMAISMKRLQQWSRTAAETGRRLIVPIRFWPRGVAKPFDVIVLSLDDFAELFEMAYKAREEAQ